MQKEMYMKIGKPSLRYDYFLFFDAPEYLADQLFIRQKVRVWFDEECAKEGSRFRAILCHVKKKDSARFLDAIAALRNKMLLCGYPEYEAEVQKMLRNLEEAKEEMYKPNSKAKH